MYKTNILANAMSLAQTMESCCNIVRRVSKLKIMLTFILFLLYPILWSLKILKNLFWGPKKGKFWLFQKTRTQCIGGSQQCTVGQNQCWYSGAEKFSMQHIFSTKLLIIYVATGNRMNEHIKSNIVRFSS